MNCGCKYCEKMIFITVFYFSVDVVTSTVLHVAPPLIENALKRSTHGASALLEVRLGTKYREPRTEPKVPKPKFSVPCSVPNFQEPNLPR